MVRPKERRAAPAGPARAAGTQVLQRAALLMRLIASRGRQGMRLAEVVQASSLEHPTAHRILKGLMAEGLVAKLADGRCYGLGPLAFELGLAAAPRFDLAGICAPSLSRVAERSGDTVFLIARSGYDSVCIDRREGHFPIKTFTLDVGTRRPLGAGAGGLALLMLLPDQELNAVVAANAARFGSYNRLSVPALLKALRRSRDLGYALNETHNTAGVTTMGLPIVNRHGQPFAAITIGAISSRMIPERQKQLASLLQTELRSIEKGLGEGPGR
jgi:DNA-binding IclR family transcriptional regulator